MKRKGFTLIELAIVLTIVGVVVGGSFQALKYSREKAYIAEAKERVSISKDAIIGYAISNGDLPTEGEFATTLSPLKGNVADQNRTFFYIADLNISNNINLCSFNATDLKVDVYDSSGAIDHTVSDVAFVLADQSANKNIQTFYSTTGGIDTVNVYANTATQDDNSRDFIRDIDEYDDIVSWTTLSELKYAVGCQDSISILTEHFPYIDINTTTSVIIFPDNEDSTFEYNWKVRIDNSSNDINYTCNDGTSGSQITDRNISLDISPNWSPEYRCTKLIWTIRYSTLQATRKIDINISDDYGNSKIKSYAVSPK